MTFRALVTSLAVPATSLAFARALRRWVDVNFVSLQPREDTQTSQGLGFGIH